MRSINLIVCTFLIVLVSCKKDKPEPLVDATLSNGILVLCEGLFQQNNASISWISAANEAVENGFFEAKTARSLGDTGNDMQRYGGKIYIVVNVSSTVEVMDALTFAPIQQIQMTANGTSKQPRSLAFNNGKVYVSCFDGFVDVIDTTSLVVEQRIAVGLNPEGMAVSGSYLYVANSGGLNTPTMDSTLSVIDLTTHTEISKITVGLNPGAVLADDQGDIYVIARGNYSTVPAQVVRIGAQSGASLDILPFTGSGFAKMGSKFLIYQSNFSGGGGNVLLFDPLSESVENSNYLNLSDVATLYGIQYNPQSDRIYCLDAMNFTNTGYVREFSGSGSY
ncbi:MAG: hypothetical protein A3D92_17415, partial [Bacteroidetes bacterium RIFCSPHIGHO2_02_FULL_44_7]